MEIFSIFDIKAEMYSRPYFALTHGEAIRTFVDAVNTGDSPYNRHPDDYTLFHVGSFDDSLGELVASQIVNLGCAQSYLRERPEGPTQLKVTG